MNKSGYWLSGLLILQIVLASAIYLNNSSAGNSFEPAPLMAVDRSAVNKIIVRSHDSEVIMLKTKDGWILPGLDGLPVDKARLDGALNTLAALKTGWPVTTTENSHERFGVAEDDYQRKISLYQADKLAAELYIGTSPGFRKAHVRPVGDVKVYALAINSYDFPDRNQDWLRQDLLSVKDITAINGPDYALVKQGAHWQFADPAEPGESAAINSDKVAELIEALNSLRVSGVAMKVPDFTSDKVIVLDAKGKQDWQFQLLKQDNNYFVKRNDREQVFTLGQYDYDRLANVRKADLKIANKQVPVDGTKLPDTVDAVNGG